MPRFLNTWTGEFEWHNDPAQVTYAILSHVWRNQEDGGEQSYDDVRRIQAAAKEGCVIPQPPASNALDTLEYHEEGTIFAHPELSDKIKGFCKVARKAGFRLAWKDACCIDKTDSAELSEAINSMYDWYRLSKVCYVHLADVSDGDDPHDASSEFYNSRWHTRGWTLQELIAPEHVVFLTKTWGVLGTKQGLASTLERVAHIELDILTKQAVLDSVSVARRISWAATRETTRVEDRAYSLMGIFGIHMPPIYGEGAYSNGSILTHSFHTDIALPDNADHLYARKDVVDALQQENDALREETCTMRTQIVGLEASATEAQAETSALRAQLTEILSRIEAIHTSQVNDIAKLECRPRG